MTIIDGKKISSDIKNEIKEEVEKIISKKLRPPHLTAVLVGDDSASLSYVRSKEKASIQVGFTSSLLHLNKNTSEKELLEVIKKLNNDDKVDGYIVQLPLPAHINEQKIIMAINPDKDVDGFHPLNLGKMIAQLSGFMPATPYGILELLIRYNINTEGKNILIIGRSLIVGRPLSVLLSQKRKGGNATVTVAHSHTKNIKQLTLQSDIIITAIGKAHFLTADMVKKGVIIIDAGINTIDAPERKRGYKLVGDVDFDKISKKASYITPVPGGVGPMTIAMLLKNTLDAYLNKL